MKSPELVRIFKQAKKALKEHQVEFICYGIEDFAEEYGGNWENWCNIARAIIATRLYPHSTYGDWIASNHHRIFMRCRSLGEEDYNLRKGRIAWLDSLIKEFS